jgi:hypothetical protein
VSVSEQFGQAIRSAAYLYDFGDNWEHEVICEGAFPRTASGKYPQCIDGASACPPEDCGGVGGYQEFLVAIGSPKHPDHKEMRRWVGRPFNPNSFNPAVVVFDDPRRRWQQAFSE